MALRSTVRLYKNTCLLSTFLLMLYLSGLGDYILTRSFEQEFNYPLNIDIRLIVKDILNGVIQEVKPINYYPYKYVIAPPPCSKNVKPNLIILVKSAMNHFQNRDAIRKTWGAKNRFPHVAMKLLFFIGIDDSSDGYMQQKINNESSVYEDIVQANFIDNYYNNTIKTMMSFRWVYTYCPNSDHYLFSDDDMYISIYNLLRYIEDPLGYPEQDKLHSEDEFNLARSIDEGGLFAGYMFKSAPPRLVTSKWHVSLAEYEWDMWPTYITAGAYIVSNKAMKILYVGSLYVKHFRFDDIYLGIVAMKTGVTPLHCKEFYFYKQHYDGDNYKDLIVSHGYSDHAELVSVWNKQRAVGQA